MYKSQVHMQQAYLAQQQHKWSVPDIALPATQGDT
jgi:hypothetical protein